MALAKPDAIYMHPLPADRNIEVTDGVIDGPNSVVLRRGGEPPARAEGRHGLDDGLRGNDMSISVTEGAGKVAVVAVGGNALILDKQHEDVASQVGAVEETCKHIADMIERGWNVIVTHGNGPQVGFILRRNELAAHEVHSTPLDVIGADTQGAIGYMIARALDNEFSRRGIKRSVAAVVTQVLVDRNDPGFKNPTKGIGGFTTKENAETVRGRRLDGEGRRRPRLAPHDRLAHPAQDRRARRDQDPDRQRLHRRRRGRRRHPGHRG